LNYARNQIRLYVILKYCQQKKVNRCFFLPGFLLP